MKITRRIFAKTIAKVVAIAPIAACLPVVAEASAPQSSNNQPVPLPEMDTDRPVPLPNLAEALKCAGDPDRPIPEGMEAGVARLRPYFSDFRKSGFLGG